MPKISVVMPVYNTDEEYLREAIESILNQTFTDFEFIIINDGSTNNAENVILSYKDSRILYLKNQENLGLIKTLNYGFDLVKGKYIARMDSDDISLPTRFEKQVEFFDKNPDIGILGTWFNCIPKNRIVETFPNDKDIKEYLLVNSNIIGHPTVMIRKSIVEIFEVKYDENHPYVEDYALWLSLIDKVKFANIPEILLDYRIHKNSVCQTKEIEQNLNVQKIMVIAQGKYFGINNKIVLDSIEKLKNGQNIDSIELLAINNFAKQVKIKMKEFGFNCECETNKVFYKYAIKKCKRDILFLKLLWANDFNQILKLHFSFKFVNSISLRHLITKKVPKKRTLSVIPKISAVMALYNTPYKFFEATIKSILSQTFSNFELIIVDDGSLLEYQDFIEKFDDNRIKYFKLDKNSGPGHARNIGIKKALGEYIAIVDSDDIYMPKRFEFKSDFLDKNPNISLLGGAFRNSNTKKISAVLEKNEEIKVFLLFNSAFHNSATMFRKNVFIEKNLFYSEKINFGEDYELWIDAMFAGIKMANLKEVLMIYIRRKNQLSKTKSEQQIPILKTLYKKIFSHLNIEATQAEIDLHHKIYLNNFTSVSSDSLSNWFDKIIERNKIIRIFDEQKLIERKNQTIKKLILFKNRIFKLKIGGNNLCVYVPFKITIEKRD